MLSLFYENPLNWESRAPSTLEGRQVGSSTG
jgi:hypothetical protein